MLTGFFISFLGALGGENCSSGGVRAGLEVPDLKNGATKKTEETENLPNPQQLEATPSRRRPVLYNVLRLFFVLTINEIFHSIQGESTHTGRPCVFVRLTACDLRCSWCDTPYAFTEGHKMSLDEVVEKVDAYDCGLVEITGGEPLLQREVYPLMDRLLGSGKTVMVETGGHMSIERVPGPVIKIVDVKCPGSGEAHRNDWANLDRLAPHDEVKFVIKDRDDYRVRARRRRQAPPERPRRRCPVLAGPRRHGLPRARGLDPGGQARRPPAAAGAQVHLGRRRSWRLARAPSSCSAAASIPIRPAPWRRATASSSTR